MKDDKKQPGGLFRSVWDERQKQCYHRINSRALNLTWGLLVASFLAQAALFPGEPARWLAEMGLCILLSVYLLAAYLRAGLWTMKSQQPSLRQNLLASLSAALILTALSLVRMAAAGKWEAFQQADRAWPTIRYLLLQGVFVFAAAFGILALLSRYYRRKQRENEEQMDREA